MTTGYAVAILAVTAGCTLLTRWAPFFLWGRRPLPAWVAYLGKMLPAAMMATLVVYCLREVSFTAVVGWLPPLAGVAVTSALHIWRKNTLLSIVAGTLCYMLLLRLPLA